MPSRCAWLRKSQTRCSWLLADQRADVEVGEGGTHAQRRHRLADALEERLVDGPVNQQAAAGGAGLPGVLHDGVQHDRGHVFEARVVEHDLRRLAAEFERDRAVVLRGRLRDRGAGNGGTGERDVIDAGMRGQRRAGLGAVPRDDVQRAFRKADLGREFGDAQQRQARVLRGLDHAGVACGEGGADAAAEDLHRVVPRHDVPGHAVRLADREHRHAGLVRDGLAVQLVGRAGVVLEVARDGGRIGSPLLQRLAGRARLELREFFVVRGDGLRQLHQQPPALGGGHAAPRPVERVADGAARRGHGRVDVRGGAARDAGESLAVRGIDHVDRLSGRRRDPAVVDEVVRPLGRRPAAFHGASPCAPVTRLLSKPGLAQTRSRHATRGQ